MVVIADRDVVRKLAGNRRPDLLPDSDIDGAIAFSDSFVQTATAKYDWTQGVDPAYETLKQASEYFAASEILGRYQDKEEESKNEWDRGEYLLKAIKENFVTATGGGEEDLSGGSVINMVSGTYKSWPLNPSAPYKRAFGKGEASTKLTPMTSWFD